MDTNFGLTQGVSFAILRLDALTPAHALQLGHLLQRQDADYVRYFYPFRFDDASVASVLAGAQNDVYSGLWIGATLVGFFLLRGYDLRADLPELGIMVDEKHQRNGLGGMLVETACCLAKLRGSPGVWLSVHPQNRGAVQLYLRYAFRAVDRQVDGQLVMRRDL